MEPTSEGNGDIAYLKEKRQHLEERIESQRLIQENLITSLQTLVPDLVSSLDLSLKVLSTFSPPSLSTKPKTPKTPIKPKPPPSPPKTLTPQNPKSTTSRPPPSIRALVSQILIERNPFSPIDSVAILRKLENDRVVVEAGGISAVETALKSIAESTGAVDLEEFMVSGKSSIMVMAIDQNRLLKELPENSQLPENLAGNLDVAGISRPENFPAAFPVGPGIMGPRGGPRVMGLMGAPRVLGPNMNQRPPLGGGMVNQGSKARTEEDDMKDLEALLSKKSFREMQKSKTGEELLDLIHRPTAKETAVAAKFKTKGGPQLKEYCSALTKEDCRRQAGSFIACEKVHFRRIIAPHTDINLGDCSFLDTCRHMKTCKYVHYELDPTPDVPPMMMGAANLPPPKPLKPQRAEYCSEVELGEPQWINCDIRNFRMDILGQFGVIMADPPWDIHMELPYGTMADDEMRNLNVPALQTDGLIFLWVTGRAMELGRECLELWGYKRIEELIWVKTNQLQRIIRTGRTGHWLNHSKEHCLVGIKGNPEVNRNIDTDVIVAEVRETSRKPDEMYPMLERISPRTRKLELFARMHNTHAGWMSLGNQLNGVRLVDEGLRARFKAAYPDVEVQPPSPPRASAMDTTEANVQTRSPFVGLDTKAQSQFPDITPQESYTSEDKSTIPDVEMGG
ncbi:probable N6-adenosine-methyltransferase MT-A70-like [Amborella trichopoda]|uniref:N6-adenosine-methyltransferase MT-A70-like n=1 Tax=Amborella trichopoda TaxID=13333 RepID=W1PZ08_AMBTC|nr:probable N6-adenosine-methyltransferase MT-A70-like [Amborella trichopoda]ERN13359.1 hypothetical protein AMTR_s00041p00134980 [Amborella trichopoda]|eukprot:XP_006851892.1 probable N6-adenosine-methyltransferase MT-A70-like [Amborella trichopoda]